MNKAESFLFLQSIDTNLVIQFPSNTKNNIIREDNKLILHIDRDGNINNKYNFIINEYEIPGRYSKPDGTIYLENSCKLNEQLENILHQSYFWENEINVFTFYFDLLLKEKDWNNIKCDIFFTEKVDKIFPLWIDKELNYKNRVFLRFSKADKKLKSNIIYPKFIQRKGNVKLMEICGLINE